MLDRRTGIDASIVCMYVRARLKMQLPAPSLPVTQQRESTELEHRMSLLEGQK